MKSLVFVMVLVGLPTLTLADSPVLTFCEESIQVGHEMAQTFDETDNQSVYEFWDISNSSLNFCASEAKKAGVTVIEAVNNLASNCTQAQPPVINAGQAEEIEDKEALVSEAQCKLDLATLIQAAID